MATGFIAVVHPRVHAKKYRPITAATPRRRLLAEWSRLLGRARHLRTRLPELSGAPAVDSAVGDWLADGEALALVLAATTRD